jgi:hypothetical protein
MFRNFVGTCQGSAATPYLYDIVGWDRSDVFWPEFEDKEGQWEQKNLEKLGQKVLEMRAKGVTFLPILDYNTAWSSDKSERTYDAAGRRVKVKPVDGGNFKVTTSRRDANGEWIVESSQVQKPGGWPLAEDKVSAWENYVRRVVGYLRKAPYNVEYFQIWNEAYPTSGFWNGDLDSYMKRVHLPASKIIRELGGKVVYGGWPCCGRIQDYVSLLDSAKAWGSIDVLDIHYFPLSAFDYLYKAAQDRGCKSIGIWQTELAFSQDPTFVGNTYPRFLAWCLAHDWSYPDRYRLFFFAATSPNDPKAFGYDRALVQGNQLSHHGLSMKTLNDVFSEKIELYGGAVTTSPELKTEINELKSSIEAFKVGDKKVVLAVHMVENNDANVFVDWNGDMGTIHLDADNPMLEVHLDKLKADEVASIERVDMAGKRQQVDLPSSSAEGLAIHVPIRDQWKSPAQDWYHRGRVLTFLVQINLK